MRRAVVGRFTEEFVLETVPEESLYFKSAERALAFIPVRDTRLERVCFVHRGHPDWRVPQLEWWTVSDGETGLAAAYGQTAQAALANAGAQVNVHGLRWIVESALSFIAEHGRANGKRPVIREESAIFWRHPTTHNLEWGRVQSKVTALTSDIAVAVICNGGRVVRIEDIRYVWPGREAICHES